jgi:hypothetical protein
MLDALAFSLLLFNNEYIVLQHLSTPQKSAQPFKYVSVFPFECTEYYFCRIETVEPKVFYPSCDSATAEAIPLYRAYCQ